VRVLVIPANEEMIIAREMMTVLERNAVAEEGLA